MVWYKINQRWWVDMTQVRSFGKPKDQPDTITIQYRDGHRKPLYRTDTPRRYFH